jgi:hypothetical protein
MIGRRLATSNAVRPGLVTGTPAHSADVAELERATARGRARRVPGNGPARAPSPRSAHRVRAHRLPRSRPLTAAHRAAPVQEQPHGQAPHPVIEA